MTDRILMRSARRRVYPVSQRLFPGVGCGDSECVFGHFGGLGTNEGCRCIVECEMAPGGVKVRKLAAIAMELARELVELEAKR